MKRIIIAAVSILALAAPATAEVLTPRIREKARLAAALAVASNSCEGYEVDLTRAGKALSFMIPEGDMKDDAFQNFAIDHIEKLQPVVEGMRRNRFCSDLYDIFGPQTYMARVVGPVMRLTQ